MVYSVITFGCQMNVHESEVIAGILESKGYILSDDLAKSDIIVFNTCCIRESAETTAVGNIGAVKGLKMQNPNLIVAVCGCMPQKKGTADTLVKKFPWLDIVIGTHNAHKFGDYLDEILASRKKVREIWDKETEIIENQHIKRSSGVNAWINIMYGCNNFCTYCIVPYVRGRERSRKIDDILRDVRQVIAEGYKEITLLGQNVNSYGNDFADDKINFATLLREISVIEGNFWVKFMTSHPKDLSDEVIDVIAKSDKICKYIHLPIQAGSNNVLLAMNRKYTREKYIEIISKIRKAVPNIGLSSDIMVGFPGETEEDFEQTLNLCKEIKFNNLYTFIYSKRSGTPAEKMPNQVDLATKKDRIRRLIELQFTITNKISHDCVGQEFRGLILNDKKGILSVKTDCDKLVFVKSSLHKVGDFVSIEIIDNKRNKLYGKILGE